MSIPNGRSVARDIALSVSVPAEPMWQNCSREPSLPRSQSKQTEQPNKCIDSDPGHIQPPGRVRAIIEARRSPTSEVDHLYRQSPQHQRIHIHNSQNLVVFPCITRLVCKQSFLRLGSVNVSLAPASPHGFYVRIIIRAIVAQPLRGRGSGPCMERAGGHNPMGSLGPRRLEC
jgi:hypothetical protein